MQSIKGCPKGSARVKLDEEAKHFVAIIRNSGAWSAKPAEHTGSKKCFSHNNN
jgi:hypothetical protein